jgi:hypothetical protein
MALFMTSGAQAFTVAVDGPNEVVPYCAPNEHCGNSPTKIAVTLTVPCEEVRFYGNPLKETVLFKVVFDMAEPLGEPSAIEGDVIELDRSDCLFPGVEPMAETREFNLGFSSFGPAATKLLSTVDVIAFEPSSTPFPSETIPTSEDPAEFIAAIAYVELIQGEVGEPIFDGGYVSIPIQVGGFMSGVSRVDWRVTEGREFLILPDPLLLPYSMPGEEVQFRQVEVIIPIMQDFQEEESFQWIIEATISPAWVDEDVFIQQRAREFPLMFDIEIDPDTFWKFNEEELEGQRFSEQPIPGAGPLLQVFVLVIIGLALAGRNRNG